MIRHLTRGLWLATLVLAGCSSSSPPTATAGDPRDTDPPPVQPTHDERDCLWLADSDALNVLLPDRKAIYWLAILPIPPGGSVEISGDFPHARYASFNLYNPLLQPIDALSDFQIAPEPGAVNPFPIGAQRDADARAYRVQLVADAIPAERAINTLYAAQTLGPVEVPTNLAVLLYRVYVPDQGRDASGGTGLPHIRFHTGDGTTITGSPACSYAPVVNAVLPDLADLPDALADLPINTAAFEHLLWLKFYDLQSSQASRVYATPLGPAVYEVVGSPTQGRGGFLSNADNRYIYATMSRALGDLVAVHAQFPTAPRTFDGNPRMDDADMRYWSLCTNDGNTTAVLSCLYDEQLVRDAQGRGVIVVSTAADRPSNATAACGVTWLDWGPHTTSLLVLRNMLPKAQDVFPYAIQYIEGPPGQHEADTMGPYYPYATHFAKAAFEAFGCPVSPDALPSVVTPPPA